MNRRLRYQVAMSLDGFIAGPNGEYDWIVMDRSIDFAALYKEFDTAVMGRKTYETAAAQGVNGSMPGIDVVVCSRTLAAAVPVKGVRIVNDDAAEVVAALKAKSGGDIWLFGGGAQPLRCDLRRCRRYAEQCQNQPHGSPVRLARYATRSSISESVKVPL